MKLSLHFLSISVAILFIVSLQPVLGEPLANAFMWAVAGYQIGKVAKYIADWANTKYFKDKNV